MSPASHAQPAPGARGVTLIEVMISVVILSVVLLAMGRYLVDFSKAVRRSEARTVAINLAAQRLSEIRASPNYSGLEAAYAVAETSIPGFPRYTRTTTIAHVGGPRPTYANDYKTVTIVVTSPGLTTPVTKTIVVAAP
jgi:prepilin-type N-terminal cleavage/methylation domain-containing protein